MSVGCAGGVAGGVARGLNAAADAGNQGSMSRVWLVCLVVVACSSSESRPGGDAGATGDAAGTDAAADAATCGPSCGTCCVDGACLPEPTDDHCPTTPGACEACPATTSCRYNNVAFACITTLPDGATCTQGYECAGAVCNGGHCASACYAEVGACYADKPCCDGGDVCAPPPIPGASRRCCAPAGTAVGADVTGCTRCCDGLTCKAVNGAYTCGA
jgi:hypothetical protein